MKQRNAACEEIVRIDGMVDETSDGRIGAGELRVLAAGAVLAAAASAIPFTRFVLSTLVTLFHELGHAVAGWLFGHPSLPAFDFAFGGGFTHQGPFRLSVAVAIGGAFVWGMWLFRENRGAFTAIALLFAMWLVIVVREWRREIVFAAAGHVAELVLAAIFFYRALAGVGWRSPELERPAGAFVAFFVYFNSVSFAWKLTHDSVFLDLYREGKGGALMNDLEVIALDLQINLGVQPGIEGVARLLLLFSAVPLIVALLWYLNRRLVHRVIRSLMTADA